MSCRRLEGRIALVTGAGSGIGQAIAVEFAREGAHVVVNDLPVPPAQTAGSAAPTARDRAEVTAELVRAEGSRALVCHCDVSDRSAVQRMVEQAVRHFGRLDIVVANAYYSKRQPLLEQEWDQMQKTFEVTQFGAYHTCQLGAKAMVEHNPPGAGGRLWVQSRHLPHTYTNMQQHTCAYYAHTC